MMNDQINTGVLYIVATPIGNLGDITRRALSILNEVDQIAAEDTRHSRRLLSHYGINTPLISLHEHNEAKRSEQLLTRLQQGQSLALISDAGTPVISDPGYRLIQQIKAAGVSVVPIPGPCAAIAALSASGLPAEQFIFAGFLPAKSQQRINALEKWRDETKTWLCYESPHRILALLEDMQVVLGEQRYVVIARELTKQFETIHGAALDELIMWMKKDPNQQRGEFVVIVKGAAKTSQAISPEAIRVLRLLLDELPLKQAAALTAKICHEKKNRLYEYGLLI